MINSRLSLNPELGQVWTPMFIANEMVNQARLAHPKAKRVLDPACGPATFSTAFNNEGLSDFEITCYDIDERMVIETESKNKQFGMNSKAIVGDYLADESLAGKFDLVIMNPPYIRQELIHKSKKNLYNNYLSRLLECVVDRRSNLFALFMLKGIVDLASDGILCSIVYDAISHSNYGKKTLSILERHAELLYIKSIQAPFNGVLVDAQILIYRKKIVASKGVSPKIEAGDDTLVTIGELLQVRRGTALPKRKAFLASSDDPYFERSSPFFIKQSNLDGLVVVPDKRAYLADSQKTQNDNFQTWLTERVKAQIPYPSRTAIKAVCGPLAFNYYIRNAPRHLWNIDNVALADNFYVSNPIGDFPAEVAWLLLNSDIYLDKLTDSARNQGNGLLKLQLYEYKQVLVPDWRRLPNSIINELQQNAQYLIDDGANYQSVRRVANELSKEFLNG